MAAYYKTQAKSHVYSSGSTVRHLQDEFMKTFGEQKLQPKPATKVRFDEREITICPSSKELSKARKVKLRSAWQTLAGSEVKLSQFDPNFFSKSNSISCRSPGCQQKRKRQPGVKKEDLYLCPLHRKTLEDFVAKTCKEKEVVLLSTKGEDFEDYTSLIGTLENAFASLTKPQAHLWPKFKTSSNVVQEVFLNMRNYLIIVNALLNPDNENVNTACAANLALLQEILVILRNDGEVIVQRLTELVALLRILIEHILFTFGVVYSWIYLSLSGNPAAQIGAGVGGVCGFLGFAAGPGVGAFTTIAGATFGGLIGSGLYGIYHQDHEADDVMFQRYHNFIQANHHAQGDPLNYQVQAAPQQEPDTAVYYLTGSATGDLLLLVVMVVGIGVPPLL